MVSWLYSGLWFMILFVISYLAQPRTYSIKGKMVFGGTIILLGLMFVMTYVALFSSMRPEALIALLGGLSLGFTSADIRKTRKTNTISRQLLEQPEFQERLKHTTDNKEIAHIVLEARIKAKRIMQAETTQCARCGKEFLDGERDVIEDIQYCSNCAKKQKEVHQLVYYVLIGALIMTEIVIALGIYSDVQRGFPFEWEDLKILLYLIVSIGIGIFLVRNVVKRGAERISPTSNKNEEH